LRFSNLKENRFKRPRTIIKVPDIFNRLALLIFKKIPIEVAVRPSKTKIKQKENTNIKLLASKAIFDCSLLSIELFNVVR
jgi:hypothetical protein